MSVDTAAADLQHAVSQARPWLLGLDEATVRHRPAPDRWTIAEVVGHLVDSACNNHQRFIRAQEQETLEFPKYDQNAWVDRNNYAASPWTELVELWTLYNVHLAHVIRQVPAEQLGTQCTITPYEPCTLEFLITDYVAHLNRHLRKIRERIDE